MAVNYFRIKASDIRGRLDSGFYVYGDIFKNSSYPKVELSQYIKVNPSIKLQGDNNTPISFIPMTNVLDKNEGNGYIADSTTIENAKGFTVFERGDLIWALITPCMQNGKSVVLDNLPYLQGCGSTEFHVLRPIDTQTININYVHSLLKMDKFLVEVQFAFSGTAGQQRITKTVLENLQIPLPPMKIQQEIADIMDHAYTEKQRLESEARELLNSIDSYVMDKLGIEQTQQITPTNKWFTVKASDIRGNRWDAPYYISQGKESTSKYPIITLDECSINQGSYGANETAIDIKEDSYTRYIRITDIDIYGQLKLKGQKTANNINERYILQTDDFLFARTGSVGRTFLYKEKYGKSIFAGYLIKFILNKDKIYPEYLFYYTQTSHYWAWVNKHQRPAVQSNINADEYRSLQIPLPPLEIQKEIALECETRRNTAQQNQQLAQDILAKAKAKVEDMLFGEELI